MRSITVRGLALSLGLLTLTGVARARPNHSGFTGDLGAGLAVTFVGSQNLSNCVGNVCSPDSYVNENKGQAGFALPSVSLGGFVTRRVAILGRSASTAFSRDGDFYSYGFLGPIVEVWPHDVFFFSAGPGLTVAARNAYFLGTGEAQTAGWGLDLRAGFALLRGTHNDLTLSAEVIPSFYSKNDVDAHAVGCALVAAWKWY